MTTSVTATVLVTGIGGNVGQGILRNIRAAFPNIRLVGTDIAEFTAGHFFCDVAERVPYAYDAAYLDTMAQVCHRHGVDLVMPSTDYEVFYLTQPEWAETQSLPPVIASSHVFVSACLDKYKTAQAFEEAGVPFASSVLPRDYQGQWASIIVKPREGRGSRNVTVQPDSLAPYDDSYIVQPCIDGDEITTAFYVTREKACLGPITFVRSLSFGMTGDCQVVSRYDDALTPIIEGIVRHFDVAGPCNIQAKVTTAGEIVPFEINCRYSGTNSIRSQLGFPDVRYGIEEYLLNQTPVPQAIRPGRAMRVFMDVVYPDWTPEQGHPKAGSAGAYLY